MPTLFLTQKRILERDGRRCQDDEYQLMSELNAWAWDEWRATCTIAAFHREPEQEGVTVEQC
jgi:hypothetical protein